MFKQYVAPANMIANNSNRRCSNLAFLLAITAQRLDHRGSGQSLKFAAANFKFSMFFLLTSLFKE